jgi:sigma-B regulation protein RsbQ
MALQQRNNVRVLGNGPATIIFAHGFGCDQTMWRLLAPSYAERYRVVLFDHVGGGGSDLSAYDRDKYDTLQGYADDVLELVEEFGLGPVFFVGHSVSAMMGLLADVKAPSKFAGQIMVGPSPCYINDGDYVGGFTRKDIDSLLETLAGNYLGWEQHGACNHGRARAAGARPRIDQQLLPHRSGDREAICTRHVPFGRSCGASAAQDQDFDHSMQ